MKQNKIKIGYQAPYTEVIVINNETLLADTSMPGQHRPGNHKKGPNANNAKQGVSPKTQLQAYTLKHTIS